MCLRGGVSDPGRVSPGGPDALHPRSLRLALRRELRLELGVLRHLVLLLILCARRRRETHRRLSEPRRRILWGLRRWLCKVHGLLFLALDSVDDGRAVGGVGVVGAGLVAPCAAAGHDSLLFLIGGRARLLLLARPLGHAVWRCV